MQTVTQNKKLKPNSMWRALELLLFDSSRLWVEARNCFLVEMSKDRKIQVNEMIEIKKSKQTISQVRKVKQWKAIKKPIANTSNLFRGSSYCSTSPPPPPWRISTKSTKEISTPEPLHPRDYNWSTQDRSTQLQPIQPLHKRDLNTRKYKSLGDQKTTNSLLQLLIEWRWFLAQEVKWEKFHL